MNKGEYLRISIITPSLNQGGFIRQTIDSILNQNYPNLEYWIIDGGSTDDTVPILKSYGEKIFWLSKKDHGQTAAINIGLQRVTGDIIAYLNADDLYLPNTLHAVSDYFLAYPEAQWITGDYFIVDVDGKLIQSYIAAYKRYLRRKPTLARLAVANFIVQPSTFWRSSLTNEIGYFDEKLSYCMDFDYWLRAIKKHPVHVLHRHFSVFRIHDLSKGSIRYGEQFAEGCRVMKRHTNNVFLRMIHAIHAAFTVSAYKLLK